MLVNLSPRLIEKMIKNGYDFKTIGSIPLGLYATDNYKSDDIIYVMSGNLMNKPTKRSIHIGSNMHLEDDYGQYINHSFDPNIKVDGNKLVAIKEINKYDELTFNYNDSELEMAEPFEDDNILVCGKKS